MDSGRKVSRSRTMQAQEMDCVLSMMGEALRKKVTQHLGQAGERPYSSVSGGE